MADNKKLTNLQRITCCVPIIILGFLCLLFIRENDIIKIVGDEYGYWSAAAYMSGLDWSELTSYNSYYGYGYGIFLALILKMNFSAVLSYKISIILNLLFLWSIYFIVLHLVNKWCKKKYYSIYIQIGIAFTVTVYTSNLYYTQYSTVETLLGLLYWLLILNAVKLLDCITRLRCFSFIFLTAYIFAVHQRTVGVCVVCVLFFIYLMIKNNKGKKFWITSFIVAILLFGVVLYVKGEYQTAFFAGGRGENLVGNDFGGQVHKLKQLLSAEGIWMFIKAFCGKIYYACSSTYLLVTVPICLVIKLVVKQFAEWRKDRKKISEELIILLFAVLSSLAMMAVGSLFMIEYYGRFDVLIYGRYFDFTMSPLILVALLYLFETSKKVKIQISICIVGLYSVLSCLIHYIQDYGRSMSNVFINCPGIADIMIKQEYQEGGLIVIAIRAIIIYSVIVALTSIRKGKAKTIFIGMALIVLSFCWIKTSLYVYKQGCLSWSIRESNSTIELFDEIKGMDAEDKLYYYVKEDVLKADTLQFMLKDSAIHCFLDIEDLLEKPGEKYILTIKNPEIEWELENFGYEIIEESETLKFWGLN